MKNNIFRKIFTSLFIFIYICTASGVLVAPAWAEAGAIVIESDGTTTYKGGTNPYVGSSDRYFGVNSTAGEFDLGDNVSSISTNGYANARVVGIRLETTHPLTANSITGGIDVKSSGGTAVAIEAMDGSDNNYTLKGIGTIKAEAKGAISEIGNDAMGIRAVGGSVGKTLVIQASSLTAKSDDGDAYAFYGSLNTGRSFDINISGSVEVTGAVGARGILSSGGSNTNETLAKVHFGSLTVSAGTGRAYGINTDAATTSANVTITLGGDMIVTSQGNEANGMRLATLGVYNITGENMTMNGTSEANGAKVSAGTLNLTAKEMSVTATKVAADKAWGLYAKENGVIIAKLDKLTVTGNASSLAILAESSGTVTLSNNSNDSVVITGAVTAQDSGTINLKNATVAGKVTVASTGTLNIGDSAASEGTKSTFDVNQTISNSGQLNIYNTAMNKTGAELNTPLIENSGTIYIKGSTFTNASTRGVIQNPGTMVIEDSSFIGNKGINGDGPAIRTSSSLTFKGNNLFQNNENTASYAGAVINYYTTFDFEDGSITTFDGNKARSHGGALMNGGQVNTSIINFKSGSTGIFTNNTSGYRGGAIVNVNIAQNIINFASGSKLLFAGNKAAYNTELQRENVGGGAIFNRCKSVINFGGNAVFVDNTVVDKNGNVTNNDILNEYEASNYGTLYFKNGSKTFFGGGITTLESGGVATIESGAEVTFGGTLNIADYGFTDTTYSKYNKEYKNIYIDQALTNGGTLNISNATVAASITNNDILTATNTTFASITNKGTMTATDTTFNAGLVSDGATAVATLYNPVLGSSLTFTAKNSGKIKMLSGTMDAKTRTLASYFGSGSDDHGFVLDDTSLIDTTSNQVFNTALGDFTGNPKLQADRETYISNNSSCGSLKDFTKKIDFQKGTVQLNDAYYTLNYVTTAKEALANASTFGTGNGLTSLAMTGDLVTADGINTTTVNAIDDGKETVTTYDKVTALTINGSLLVGTKTVSEESKTKIADATGITVKDLSATSTSVDTLDLKQDSINGLIITNDKYVTLGGKSGREATEASNVINVDNTVADVDVVVGLDQATAAAIGLEKKGTFTIGNGVEDKDTKYKVTGNVTVNEESELNVAAKSEATITKDLTLKGAAIKVEDKGVLNVAGTTTVENSAAGTTNTISGTVKGDKLINNGTLAASASDLQFGLIENNSMHTLELLGGVLSSDVTSEGAGSVVIKNDVTSLGINFVNQYITVESGKELCFSGSKTTITRGGLVAQNATLAFNLDDFKVGDIIVKTDNAVDVSQTTIKLLQEQVGEKFTKEGDNITLISRASGYAGTRNDPKYVKVTSSNALIDYTYPVFLNAGALVTGFPSKGAAEEAKSLSEGFIAGSVALMQAGDLAATTAIETAQTATQTATTQSVMPYAVIQGGHGRYHTGSHVDMNSVQIAAGVAQKFSDSTIGGILIEGGNGRYTSYNEFTSGELRADGEVKYYGAGIFAKHSFSKSDKGNAYVDASFSAGRTNQDYRTAEIRGVTDYHYDTGVTYLKAHATAGYEWHLGKSSLNGYVKYLWSCQNGATINFNGEDVNFDAINSHRVRVGARYTQKIEESLAWYGGLAYEYEFDASAGASSMGLAIAEPDLKGGSGMAEIGLKYMPLKAKNWMFDLGLEGFLGKRDSLGARLAVWYMFGNK